MVYSTEYCRPRRRAQVRDQKFDGVTRSTLLLVAELTEPFPPSSYAPKSASAFSSQYVMPMSRYIVVAVARCSWACSACPCAVELAEAEVAVGDERAHAELFGQGQRLREGLARFGWIRRRAGRGAFAEDPQRLGLIPAFPIATRQLERFLHGLPRVIWAGRRGGAPPARSQRCRGAVHDLAGRARSHDRLLDQGQGFRVEPLQVHGHNPGPST